MGLRHDNPNSLEPDPLRTQRMTADEAKSVIALWQQERVAQTGLTDRPAVPDVAEGLDIAVKDVQRLLQEVRARRLEEERALAQEQELAQAEIRLAEEEFELANIQQQRAQMRMEKAERRVQAGSGRQGKEVEPVPWEVWKAAQARPPRVKSKSSIRQEAEVNTTEADQHEGGGLNTILSSTSPFWLVAMAALALLIYLSTLH